MDQVVSGTVVALDLANAVESEFYIDSKTAKKGFSGSAVGFLKLVDIVQGEYNASAAEKRQYGNLTSIELG